MLFGTGNPNKLQEIRQLLGEPWQVLGLKDVAISGEVPETGSTLEENARLKAVGYGEPLGLPCFADDTGLEVDALNGAPGVHSARYAGEAADPKRNMEKLLAELQSAETRAARFRTVIALWRPGQPLAYFEGAVQGEIMPEPAGSGGFGYDPIFRAEGFSVTFAEMPPQQKNAISHRGQAVRKLIAFLKNG